MAFNQIKYASIYNAFDIELTFEFYSYYSAQKAASLLKAHLGKEIVLEDDIDYAVSPHIFQLRSNPVFQYPYLELKTGKLSYQEARFVIIRVFEKIKEFGFTEKDNFMRVNLSSSGDHQGIPALTRIDRLGYILNLDESLLWTKFDNLKNSPFVRSVYHLVPSNKRLVDPHDPLKTDYDIPNGEIYGVDFTKLDTGKIQYNYVGGANYEKKIQESLDCLDYYMISIAKAFTRSSYDHASKAKLATILDDIKDAVLGYESPEKFKEQYPDITISVDLKDDIQTLKSFWDKIKDPIFDLLVNSDVKKGFINYDTTLSRMQMKDMKFSAYYLEGFEIIDCEITNSHIKDCNIYRSIIKDCRVNRTNFYASADIIGSKLKDCYCNRTVEVIDSYIHGKSTVFNGMMDGGIFKEGNVGIHAQFKKNVKKVEFTEIKPTKLKVD